MCPKNGFSKGLVPRSCHKSKIRVQERASPKVMSQVQNTGMAKSQSQSHVTSPKHWYGKGLVPKSCHKSKTWVWQRASPKVMSQVQNMSENNDFFLPMNLNSGCHVVLRPYTGRIRPVPYRTAPYGTVYGAVRYGTGRIRPIYGRIRRPIILYK